MRAPDRIYMRIPGRAQQQMLDAQAAKAAAAKKEAE
jgi:hypothetical protein